MQNVDESPAPTPVGRIQTIAMTPHRAGTPGAALHAAHEFKVQGMDAPLLVWRELAQPSWN